MSMFNDLYLTAILSLIGTFALVIYLIPKIRIIIERRHLIDNPDKRSSHKISTPTMAGISFFLTKENKRKYESEMSKEALLRQDFEDKYDKAVNLKAYEKQDEEIKEVYMNEI